MTKRQHSATGASPCKVNQNKDKLDSVEKPYPLPSSYWPDTVAAITHRLGTKRKVAATDFWFPAALLGPGGGARYRVEPYPLVGSREHAEPWALARGWGGGKCAWPRGWLRRNLRV